MVSPNTTTITTTHSHNSRWIPKSVEQQQQRSSGWTEVVSKHHKRQPDPFAGMKSCVDYEQEIERLKQLVLPQQQHNNNNKKTINRTKKLLLSRSTSPDTTHSSDSDLSLPESEVITEQEKVRFLAFVRNWTGDWKGSYGNGDLIDTNLSTSLWAEQSPWNYSKQQHASSSLSSYNNNPLVISMPNKHTAAAVTTPPINTILPSYDLYWQTTVQNQPPPQPAYNYYQSPLSSNNNNKPIGMGRGRN